MRDGLRIEKRKKQGGFTLVELVTVIAIVAILAAIAIPGYRNHVRKSRRAAAKAALVDGAMSIERLMTRNGSYAAATIGDTAADTVNPATVSGGKYALGFAAGEPTATTFEIEAVPQGGQAADPCGTLSIDQTGNRTASGTDPSGPCW